MSAAQEYLLRWRGRPFGPYTVEEINRLLDEHEIGMGHEIQYQNSWVTLEEFLETIKLVSHRPDPVAWPRVASPPAEVAVAGDAPPPSAPKPGTTLAPPDSVAPPPLAAPTALPAPVDAVAVRPRYRVIYALLAILLGFSGVHNFYARNWLTGVVQLLVSCASFLLGFGIIVPWLWAMVEAVVVRKDGYEMEMS